MRSLAILLTLCSLASSCKKEGEDPAISPIEGPVFKIEDVLKNWSSEIVIPAYEDYSTKTEALYVSATNFDQSVTKSNLVRLKEDWKSAYSSWQRVAMFEFGPAANITLRGQTNIYPTDTAQLNQLIEEKSVAIEGASKLDVKGFPAIDYLLNSADEDEVVNLFNSASKGKSRMHFLLAVVSELKVNAALVLEEWKPEKGNYANQFNSAVGTDVGSSLGVLINTLTQHIERHLRDGKLGIPNGNRNFSGTALPTHVEAPYYADLSVELALENIEAIERLYLGNSLQGSAGKGLDDYLISLNAKYGEVTLDKAIKDQLAECKQTITALPSPLKEHLVTDKDKIDEAVKSLQKLIVLFKADIPSATGILITYQDNDGD